MSTRYGTRYPGFKRSEAATLQDAASVMTVDTGATTLTLDAHLIPGAHDTYRIGTTSTPNWSDVYVAGVVGPADP